MESQKSSTPVTSCYGSMESESVLFVFLVVTENFLSISVLEGRIEAISN